MVSLHDRSEAERTAERLKSPTRESGLLLGRAVAVPHSTGGPCTSKSEADFDKRGYRRAQIRSTRCEGYSAIRTKADFTIHVAFTFELYREAETEHLDPGGLSPLLGGPL